MLATKKKTPVPTSTAIYPKTKEKTSLIDPTAEDREWREYLDKIKSNPLGTYKLRDDYDTDAMLSLKAKAEQVNLRKVGIDSTYKPESLSLDGFNQIKSYIVAQALFDNISSTESGISLRMLAPDLDFLDGAYNKITTRDWTLPANGWYKIIRNTDPNTGEQYIEKMSVLRTHYMSGHHLKEICIFGITIPEHCHATCMDIKRGNVKIIEVIPFASMKANTLHMFTTPVLVKRNDEANIQLSLNAECEGQRDKILLHGIVGESVGSSQTG